METGSLWGSHLGSLQLSHSGSGKSKMRERANFSPKKSESVEVWKFNQMMSKVQFAPHRRSLFHHSAPSMCGPTPVSGDTACGSMSSQNQHSVPSCQQQWYPQLPTGNMSCFLKGTSLSVQSMHPCCRDTC